MLKFQRRRRTAFEARVWGARGRKWVSEGEAYRIIERVQAYGVKLPRRFLLCRLEDGKAIELLSDHRTLGAARKAAEFHSLHGRLPVPVARQSRRRKREVSPA